MMEGCFMDQATIDSTRRWLTKASHDLLAAQRASMGDDEALDTCVYHCQQAAEKAFKGFLVAHAVTFPKTHSLVLLLPLCSSVELTFQQWRTEAALLAPLAYMFRYPDDFAPLEPTRAEFTEALDAAQRLFDFVLSLLPPETHPA
jgi:HEPN domain-containing protein